MSVALDNKPAFHFSPSGDLNHAVYLYTVYCYSNQTNIIHPEEGTESAFRKLEALTQCDSRGI